MWLLLRALMIDPLRILVEIYSILYKFYASVNFTPRFLTSPFGKNSRLVKVFITCVTDDSGTSSSLLSNDVSLSVDSVSSEDEIYERTENNFHCPSS